MPIKTSAELDIDAVGGVGKEIGAQRRQDCFKQGDHGQADHQHLQRADPAMHEDLVDDNLKEKRADQREDLKEERGDQNLGQQMAILHDRAEKPCDIEPPRQIGKRRPARHQDQMAIPDLFELSSRELERTRIGGTLYQYLLPVHPANEEKAALSEHGDAGQGHARQACPPGLDRARLETERLRASQHLGHPDAACAHPVAELLSVGRDAVQPEQQNESKTSGFLRRHRFPSIHHVARHPRATTATNRD